MSKTVNTRVKLKYDTYANWNSVGSTFTPLKGEVIYYSDLSKFKVGDGETALNDLSYFTTDTGDYVTLSTSQTIAGVKTFNAPTNKSGTEQATAVFKTANGGQIIFGKEAGNSGSMIALDQVAGTRRLNLRASATAPGEMVWSQPESNSSLFYDVKNIYYQGSTGIQFTNFKSAGALGTDASGNLKKVTLATVATSGSYSDLSNLPDLADIATSGSYNDLINVPTIDSAISSTSTNAVQNKVIYTALSGKQASLTTAQLNACNSGITSSKVTTYDGYASQISAKQDKLTAGSNITISGSTISSSYTDTKNTAGSTEYGVTGSPLYLIGANTQGTNPTTNSSKYCYIQYGSLYSFGRRVAETYTEDSEHYIQTEAGFYKISGASTKNSDGTYNYVTILTTENLAETGLFVPMTGTINTPMSGGIHQKFAYDVQTSSGGLSPAGGGSVTTSTRYAEAFYGEKGFEYVYYWKDSNYSTDDSTALGSYGITYKPLEGTTNTGYYTDADVMLNEGLNIWKVSTSGYGTNTGYISFYPYLEYLSLLPDATIKYKSSGSTAVTTIDLKNLQTKLVSGTSIKTINSKSLLGSGNLSATDIIPTATTSARGIAYLSGFQRVDGTGYATSGYFFDTETGWMICYGTTGTISGAGNAVTFAKSFVGAPLVVVSPFTKSTTETTISTQYRNACTVRCYRNTSGNAYSSYNASTYYGSFILDTGNTESGYFSYVAIGRFK